MATKQGIWLDLSAKQIELQKAEAQLTKTPLPYFSIKLQKLQIHINKGIPVYGFPFMII